MPDPLAGLPPRFLRTPEAARFLGLSGRTLEKHRTYGAGPKYGRSVAMWSMRSMTSRPGPISAPRRRRPIRGPGPSFRPSMSLARPPQPAVPPLIQTIRRYERGFAVTDPFLRPTRTHRAQASSGLLATRLLHRRRRMIEFTHVELTFLEKRVQNWIRFGRIADERVIDRQRRIISFSAGQHLCHRSLFRQRLRHCGLADRHSARRSVRRAFSTVPFVRPGGESLLRLAAGRRSRRPAGDRYRRGARHRSG